MAEIGTQGEPETQQLPTMGDHGETCETCAAPLAVDQRYCLNCGTRRAGPRVDYATYMTASSGPTTAQANATGEAPPAPPADGEPEKKERDFAPLAAVGGIAVLGLMLLVGVLIGKGDSEPAAAPAPVVVHGGEEASAATATGKGGEAGGAGAKGGSAKATGKGGNGGGSSTGAAAPASTDDLEALNQQSGKAYEEASKNLPNEIATPGAPPPIDKSKAPGGGEGGGVTIK